MQSNMFSDAIEAVKSYAASQNLTPAFGGVVDVQIGNNVQVIALQVSTVNICICVLYETATCICVQSMSGVKL